ncbi:hypothetical protein VO467_000601 [Shigella sonnei]|nr:hypothetical protein [Shigella sonnei]
MEQELDIITSKKRLEVVVNGSTIKFVYDTLTDAITVSCGGKAFSLDSTENKYPFYKGIFDMGVDISVRQANYLHYLITE